MMKKLLLGNLHNLREKRVHLIGIAGSGMLSLAEALSDLGFIISGSDPKGLVPRLKRINAKVYNKHLSSNVPDNCEFIVWSSAVKIDNPEMVFGYENNIPIFHRAEIVADISRVHAITVGVSGSHGKTSTTSLVYHALKNLGASPSFLIGGEYKVAHVTGGGLINDVNRGGRVGEGGIMVVESDESDRSFLKIKSDFPVVTNIDREHMTSYADDKDIDLCFEQFVNSTPFFGKAFLSSDCPRVKRVFKELKKKAVWYGLNSESEISASDIESNSDGISFNLEEKGKILSRVKLSLPGEHMVHNSLVAWGIAREFGYSAKSFAEAISEEFVLGRRAEVVHESEKLVVISDYAHHPVEVQSTLEGLRSSYSSLGYKMNVVFEPHRFTRMKECFSGFLNAFDSVSSVCVLPVYAAGEEPIDGFRATDLVKIIQNKSSVFSSYDNLPLVLNSWIGANCGDNSKKVLVFMGAGRIDSWVRDFFSYGVSLN